MRARPSLRFAVGPAAGEESSRPGPAPGTAELPFSDRAEAPPPCHSLRFYRVEHDAPEILYDTASSLTCYLKYVFFASY